VPFDPDAERSMAILKKGKLPRELDDEGPVGTFYELRDVAGPLVAFHLDFAGAVAPKARLGIVGNATTAFFRHAILYIKGEGVTAACPVAILYAHGAGIPMDVQFHGVSIVVPLREATPGLITEPLLFFITAK
jgi:hypothetical protein